MYTKQKDLVSGIDKGLATKYFKDCLNRLKPYGSLREQIHRIWERLNKKQVIFAALFDGNIDMAQEQLATGKKLLTENDKKEIFRVAPALEGKENQADKVA